MRDDIHKHAPLPTRWQLVMRRFQSEAERPTGLLAMQQAIARDAKENFGANFLQELLQSADGQQSFGAFDLPHLSFTSSRGDRTELELAVGEALGRTSLEHATRRDAVSAAVKEVLDSRVLANCDAMETTWYVRAKGDPEAMRAANALWQAHAQCGLAATVTDLLEGRSPACLSARSSPVDLDDNLLPPNPSSR